MDNIYVPFHHKNHDISFLYNKLNNKCCVYNLWKDEKSYTRCTSKGCKLTHTDKPPKEVISSKLYKLLTKKFDGERNGETAKGWSIENIAAPASLVAQSA